MTPTGIYARKPRPSLSADAVASRFWAKVNKRGPVHPVLKTPCWLWVRKGDSRSGYGRFYSGDQYHVASRFAYQLANGAVPEGLWVLHRCDTPRCVNPEHLFLGTHDDNMADLRAKGRGNSQHRDQSHCKRGHPFDKANTYVTTNGQRACRKCKKAKTQEWNERQNAQSRERLSA